MKALGPRQGLPTATSQPAHVPQPSRPNQFSNFRASELFCPTCRRAMPVRERLLLLLLDGELHEFLCARCGTSLGTRQVKQPRPGLIGPLR